MSKILIYSLDTIGQKMAGPGIRYWEFAKALSRNHDVTLWVPNDPDVESDSFKLRSYKRRGITEAFKSADFIITQRIDFGMVKAARKGRTKIILDVYDPIILEHLELNKFLPLEKQLGLLQLITRKEQLSFSYADAYICASEKQRDLWIGSLMMMGLIHPSHYEADPSLRTLIDVVPFGLSKQKPKKNGPGIRENFNLKPSDKIIIWGGGIWNWFDPITLIKAVEFLDKKRSDIKLIFMGLKHPNEGIPEMEMSKKSVDYAKKADLVGKSVFFNYNWVPYDQRQNFFLDADIGASTHLDHLETRFSFRTRILDYLWTGLPIVATEGDSFAELIRQNNLGKVVPYSDPEALAYAIEELADDKESYQQIKANLAETASNFYWDEVVRPIDGIIAALDKMPYAEMKRRDSIKLFFGPGLSQTQKTPQQLLISVDHRLMRYVPYIKTKRFLNYLRKGEFDTIASKIAKNLRRVGGGR